MEQGQFGKNPSIVRVWNDHSMPHSEMFEDQPILILPHKSIEMDGDKAHQFLSQYFEMLFDADGQQLPKSFKMLRIEKPPEPKEATPAILRCQKCGYIAQNKNEMDGHILNEHIDDLEDKEKAIKAMNSKKI